MNKIQVFSKKLGKKVTVSCADKKVSYMGWVKSAWNNDNGGAGWKFPPVKG